VASYLDDVAAIFERLTDDSSAAIPPGTTPTHQSVSEVVEARRDALVALERLEPPEEIAPEHGVLVTVFADFVDAATSFLDEAAALPPAAFLEALGASSDIDVLAARVADACDAMRGRARTLGHPVTLEC